MLQQGGGQGLQLVQAQQLHLHVAGIPAAVGIDDLAFGEPLVLHQPLGLLAHLGRHLQRISLQPEQGAEIRDLVHAHEAEVVPSVFVDAVEAGEVRQHVLFQIFQGQ